MSIFKRLTEFVENGSGAIGRLIARIEHIEAWLEEACKETAPVGPAAPTEPPAPAAQNGGAS